jgi:hypothetical protein
MKVERTGVQTNADRADAGFTRIVLINDGKLVEATGSANLDGFHGSGTHCRIENAQTTLVEWKDDPSAVSWKSRCIGRLLHHCDPGSICCSLSETLPLSATRVSGFLDREEGDAGRREFHGTRRDASALQVGKRVLTLQFQLLSV